ncbi:MAG: hypothetical protein ACYCX4_05505 [Bacillota bacterium]
MKWGNGSGKIYKRLMKAGLTIVVMLTGMLILLPSAMANPGFFAQIPEGFEPQTCNLCHVQPPVLNSFGKSFQKNGYTFDGLENPGAKKEVPKDAPDASKDTTQGTVATPVVVAPKLAVEMLLPDKTTRGEKMKLQAKVTTDGQPSEGKKVEFYEEANFFISGKVKLGEATTDASGIASINYWPRSLEKDVKLSVSVPGEDGAKSVEGAGTISPAPTGSLIKTEEGLTVPYVGNWLIAVLVSGVWLTYAFVVVTTLRLRKVRDAVQVDEVSGEEEKQQYA